MNYFSITKFYLFLTFMGIISVACKQRNTASGVLENKAVKISKEEIKMYEKKGAYVYLDENQSLKDLASQIDYIDVKLKGNILDLDELFKKSIEKKTRLVALGESHAIRNDYAKIMSALDIYLKNFTTVFLETDKGMQVEINKYLKDEPSDITSNSPYFLAIEYAKKAKKKIYAIDQQSNLFGKNEEVNIFEYCVRRNKIMAERVSELLAKDETGVVINGSAHLASSLCQPSLKATLKIPVQQFDTVGKEFVFVDGQNNSIKLTAAGDGIGGFLTADDKGKTTSKTNRGLEGKTYWGDYDGILLVPYD